MNIYYFINLLEKCKWVIVSLAVLLLLYLGFYLIQSEKRDKESMELGNIMYKAILSNSSMEESIKLLNEVSLKNSDSGYKYLAQFKLASIYSNNDIEKAQDLYDSLAQNKKVKPELRELAQYLESVLLLRVNKIDIFNEKISKLVSNKEKVYDGPIKELLAVSMIKSNDINGSIAVLQEIDNKFDTNAIIKKNAKELLQIYSN